MNKTYKIIKPIMLVIIVLLAIIGALSLYNAAYKQLMSTEYAFLFDYSTHEVIEENMSPDFDRGDLAIIKRDYIYTAGKYVVSDKLNTTDPEYEITDALVLGKTVSKIKNFAGVYNVITSTYMMIGIIIFIGAYFFLTMNEKPKTYI